LQVNFGGPGQQPFAARADHAHQAAGLDNTAIGDGALPGVTTGDSNTAAGRDALESTTTGFGNVGAGRLALAQNTSGSQNTAVGLRSLQLNVDGQLNAALGAGALLSNSDGGFNTAVGAAAGGANTSGSRNTFVGNGANPGSGTLTNATAVGAGARVDQSNAIVLGGITGLNGAITDVNVGIGTPAPGARLDIATEELAADVRITVADGAPDVVGRASGGTRDAPSAIGDNGVLLALRGHGHTGVGFDDGGTILLRAVSAWSPTSLGTRVEFQTTAVGTSNQDVRMIIDHDGEVGIGTTTPAALLHVAGTARVDTLGAAGATPLCRNASFQIATCSSSRRYKHDLADFGRGLDVVHRLRPVSFRWNGDGSADVGFGAEDVAAIDPRLAVFNADGTVEGVKYDRLTTVLVNAVKELEAQNGSLVERNQSLEQQMAALARRLAVLEQAAARHADARTR
jgi:hypothetical protein